jgi:hypothetical protein
MFVYAGRSEAEQKQWMTLAEKGKLGFNSTQTVAIRRLLRS